MQQLQQAPASATPAPINRNYTPIASACGAYQFPTPTNAPPPPPAQHGTMPAWAKAIMDQCTSMHKALESVQAKVHLVRKPVAQTQDQARVSKYRIDSSVCTKPTRAATVTEWYQSSVRNPSQALKYGALQLTSHRVYNASPLTAICFRCFVRSQLPTGN